MEHDPQEDDPVLKHIFEAVDNELKKTFNNVRRDLGFCHFYWAEKKAILRKKYNVDWKTPSEMNPDTLFD